MSPRQQKKKGFTFMLRDILLKQKKTKWTERFFFLLVGGTNIHRREFNAQQS